MDVLPIEIIEGQLLNSESEKEIHVILESKLAGMPELKCDLVIGVFQCAFPLILETCWHLPKGG